MGKGKFVGEAEKGRMGIYLFTSDICRIRYARLGFGGGGGEKVDKRDYIHCGTLYCRYRTPYCLRGLRQYFQWGNQGKG